MAELCPIDDTARDAQVRSRGLIDNLAGGGVAVRQPFHIARFGFGRLRPSAELGEHPQEVLRELDLMDGEPTPGESTR